MLHVVFWVSFLKLNISYYSVLPHAHTLALYFCHVICIFMFVKQRREIKIAHILTDTTAVSLRSLVHLMYLLLCNTGMVDQLIVFSWWLLWSHKQREVWVDSTTCWDHHMTCTGAKDMTTISHQRTVSVTPLCFQSKMVIQQFLFHLVQTVLTLNTYEYDIICPEILQVEVRARPVPPYTNQTNW